MTRVGLIGPLPPTRSGVATYNLRCVEAAPNPAALDVFLEQVDRASLPLDRRWSAWPASHLLRRPEMASDVMLATVGNNLYHRYAYEWLLEHGGIAWFHDTSVAGLLHGEAIAAGTTGAASALASAAAERDYPEEPSPPPHPRSLWSWAAGPRRWCRGVLEASSAVVAHSPMALETLRSDAGVELPPALVVPLPVPFMPQQHATSALSVVSMGFLSPAKLPGVLIEAVASLGRGAQLVWAGDAVGGLSALNARRSASAGGLDGRFRLTGHLDEDAYAEALRVSSVAVQLRDLAGWSGEASGAVTEAIGAGVPVVTNIPPSSEEMAAAVVSVSAEPSAEEVAEAIRFAASSGYDPEPARAFAADNRAASVFERVVEFAQAHGGV